MFQICDLGWKNIISVQFKISLFIFFYSRTVSFRNCILKAFKRILGFTENRNIYIKSCSYFKTTHFTSEVCFYMHDCVCRYARGNVGSKMSKKI